MKKEYKDLEIETVTFDDIITASGDPLCEKDCKPYRIPCPHEDPCLYGCKCNGPVECAYYPSI